MGETRPIYFISHPNVVISSTTPVTQWPLSELGRSRMKLLLKSAWINDISAVYCSTEQKAIDGASILASHLNLKYEQNAALGENDRSATGYLDAEEFERTADEFFSLPDQSIRGWETARAAQNRIVNTIRSIYDNDNTNGDIAIVSHGAVGTLLYCFFANKTIDRRWDQPGQGGGNFFKLSFAPLVSVSWREAIDARSFTR